MKKFIIVLKNTLVSSYWFYPAGFSIMAVVVAWASIHFDYQYADLANDFIKDALFFNKLSMDTARVYLSTLVGAVITVVGVVFSLTTMTVSSASTQFGPRILNNFMRDRGNQLTLAVYTGTFVFASTVLLSLYELENQTFIPYVSIFISYLLALTCVAFLIYYIHHIPASLRVESIVHEVAAQGLAMAKERFPRNEGLELVEIDQDDRAQKGIERLEEALKFNCGPSKVGYVQAIDLNSLLAIAEEKDIILNIVGRPGDFMNGVKPLVYADKKIPEDCCDRINEAFAIGSDRTLPQNLMYLLSQIMEIGIRSMSPGINDPITAMSCVDWLEAILIKMMGDDKGVTIVAGDNKEPRLIIASVDSKEALFQIQKGLAEHLASNYATALHLMECLERLNKFSTRPFQKEATRECAQEALKFCRSKIADEEQFMRLDEIFSSFSKDIVEYPHEYQ